MVINLLRIFPLLLSVHVVLSQTGGVDFLGSPIWGSPEFLSTFVGSVVDRVSVLQTRLRDLEDPQVELYFCCVVIWVFV